VKTPSRIDLSRLWNSWLPFCQLY